MPDIKYLSEEDQTFLKRKGWNTEVRRVTLGNGYEMDIIIHEFPLPGKFTPISVDLLVRQLPGYPNVGMDMFWTRPEVFLAQTNTKPPATEAMEKYLDLDWQRWSRHFNGWRMNVDNLETFFAAVIKELNS